MSLQNVTIDDRGGSSTTPILYSPPLCNGSGWTLNEGRGFNDSYSFCTSGNKSVTPSASISFTGVGVYYISPYFPGGFMRFTLDGVESQDISLSAPQSQKNDSNATAVMWSATNLNNTQHLLELHPNNGSRTLNVDAFIITQLQSNDTPPAPTNATQTPSIIDAGGSSSLGLPEQSAKTTRLSIGLGVTFGTLSFLIFLGIAIFLGRRTKGLKQQYHWAKTVPPLHPEEEDPDVIDTRAYTQNSYQPSVPPQAGGGAHAMRPLPSIAHGSFTTRDYEGDARGESGAKGWASPAHSNTHLISKSSSSQGHGDDSSLQPQTYVRFEPVRANTPSISGGARVSSGSGSLQGRGDVSAPISRSTTFTSRLEPVRAASSQASPPPAFNASAFARSGDQENVTVSRSTTFNSTRLEPVRRL